MNQENIELNKILSFRRTGGSSYSGDDVITAIDCASCDLKSVRVTKQAIELTGYNPKKGKSYKFSIGIKKDAKDQYGDLWPKISQQLNKKLEKSIDKNISLIYNKLEYITLEDLVK